MKKLLIMSAIIAFLGGCTNAVEARDERERFDRVELPSGYVYKRPIRIAQTDTNIVVTVEYVRTK